MKYWIAVCFCLTMTMSGFAQKHNTLTKKEKNAGWQLLFDGKTTTGWRNFNQKGIGSAWKIDNGELHLEPADAGRGDIISDEEYQNFELVVDWKIEPCGNSGIVFNSIESPNYTNAWNTGPEMQAIDNACHPDAKNVTHRAGNLFDLIASPVESFKGANEWNTARILSDNGHLELWLNDVKQVETTMFTPEWEAMIKGSKFKRYPDFGTARKGHLMLQDHDNKVWYRNIKIRVLK